MRWLYSNKTEKGAFVPLRVGLGDGIQGERRTSPPPVHSSTLQRFSYSSYFTLSFYPFHCNYSKSNARHLEAHLNRIFKQFTSSNSLQKHHTLFHQFAHHFATKVFASTLFLLLLYCNKTPIVLLMYLNTLV